MPIINIGKRNQIEPIEWKPYTGETIVVNTVIRQGQRIQETAFYEDRVRCVPKGNAYVIGNGPSRQNFDLDKLKDKVNENYNRRISEVKKAEKLIEKYVIEYNQWLDSRELRPSIISIKKEIKNLNAVPELATFTVFLDDSKAFCRTNVSLD